MIACSGCLLPGRRSTDVVATVKRWFTIGIAQSSRLVAQRSRPIDGTHNHSILPLEWRRHGDAPVVGIAHTGGTPHVGAARGGVALAAPNLCTGLVALAYGRLTRQLGA